MAIPENALCWHVPDRPREIRQLGDGTRGRTVSSALEGIETISCLLQGHLQPVCFSLQNVSCSWQQAVCGIWVPVRYLVSNMRTPRKVQPLDRPTSDATALSVHQTFA